MSYIIVLIISALCVLASSAPTPPVISEVFTSSTAVTVTLFTFNVTGKGIWAANRPAGESVEQMTFGTNHPFNEWRLNRFDRHRAYEMLDDYVCRSFPLEGSMHSIWGWVQNATYSRQSFQGQEYDTWTLTLGYATLSVAVVGSNPAFLVSESPARNLTVQFLNWVNTVTNASLFGIPANCDRQKLNGHGNSKSSVVGCEDRSTMIAKAQVWVNNKVPYNQGATYQGYREDCSGYVSMAWETSKPGYTTYTLPEISSPIAKSELQDGDILLCTTEHVVLFGGWSNSEKSEYVAFEETRPGEGTVKRVTPYPYWYNTGCFKPYRYHSVC